MAYFVVYELHREGHRMMSMSGNKILLNTHPLVWAARPPEIAERMRILTTILWWIEVPDEIVNNPDVIKWCGTED